ncbi:metallophosphoesterase [Ferruginibacter paludis]|uniref:metallophosphoesterase n=1 Tax=Ferruginibacter paludis TaxID=1310417 RepID=UPI0025B32FE2|nr:metallophosphoesterase [Ferruginibacter paludis]MDN3656733.1 metallophosphoesterase [Ferruginibacter paludis]
MKKIFTLFFTMCAGYCSFAQTSFTPGNLVVVQTSGTVSKASSAITLKEFSTAGTPGISVVLPVTGTTPVQTSGVFGGSEGFLTTSTDNKYLVIGGYATTSVIADITATAASAVPRVVGTIAPSGFYLQRGISNTFYSGNDIRGAVSDGTNYWASGASAANIDGIDYFGSGVQTGIGTAAAPPKAYGLRIFNGQIFYSTQKAALAFTASHLGIFTLGSSPVSNPATITQVIDMGTTIPEDFSFNPSMDICYVAVNLNTAAGGIQKWTKSSNVWSLAYTLGTGVANIGAYGLLVDYSGANPVLYATTFDAAGNRVIKISDTGAGASATTIVPAVSNVFYKGIAFAPVASGTPEVNLTVSTNTASEAGATVITVTANASSAVSGDQTVALGVSGTGITNGDYTLSNTTITIPDGATTGSVTFAVVDDAIFEGTETAVLTMSAPSSGIILGSGTSQNVVIADNDLLNNPPSISMSVSTSNFIDDGVTIPPVSPFKASGVISDPTDPVSIYGIDFTINDAETPAANLTVTATSSNTIVVPNANIVVSGTGATRTVKITATGVGYTSITVSVRDGTDSASYIISYAASVASASTAATLWHTGISDASDAIALDDNYYITGDDELDVLNVYSRSASGLKVASFDFASTLNLPNPGKPEVDLEAATKSVVNVNRVYWLGSMSTGSDFLSRPNRDRLFATTVAGTGTATTFSVLGYGAIKNSLLAWGDAKGYNFTASAADGVDSKTPGGFAAEGMVFGPDSTTMYIGLRAPLVPTANRTKAVIAPILNFETWFNNGAPSGDPTYGSPIELDLGLRGIRDLMRLSNGTYIILAGDPGSASAGAIYKWTGKATDAPVLVNSSVAASLNMEGALPINENGSLSLSKLQVISDGGTVVLYNDGTEAKEFGDLILRKFRSDNLTGLDLNLCQNPQPASFTSKSTFVYKGENAVAYTVPNVSGETYNWSYSGTGATINGTGNSVSVDYGATATSGILSVVSNNVCGASPARTLPVTLNSPIIVNTTNYDYSFVTVGCNRVDYLDTAFTSNDIDYSTGASTANVYQLKRLFTEIAHLNPLPKYLILTGDIVMGYKTPSTPDTAELAKQLTAWKSIYESHPLSSMGIQLVAIPGNHETQDKAAGKKSFLSAEQIFTRVMAPYIRGNNGPGIGGPDSLTTDQSKLTYSFNFNGDHFIVLNTDPVGKDNQVPYKWLAGDIQAARANNARHIFAFGHKPAYSSSLTPKGGLDADVTLPQRDSLWKYLEDNNCEAMFSAHEHLWDSIHPHTGKTWQVIAGNGGSRVEPVWVGAGKQYYGYTLVNLYTDKKVNVMGLGRNTGQSTTAGGTPYPVNEDANPTTVRNDFNICLTTTSTTKVIACGSYVWNNNTYNASGTYTYTTNNAAGCDSIATLQLTVNASPVVPQLSAFTGKTTFVYKGQTAVNYTVPNVAGQTYAWAFNGTGATINGTGNSVTVDYSAAATSGNLSVTAKNACNDSVSRTLAIALNTPITVPTTNYDYSFVTVGCNRVDYLDTAFTSNDIDYSTGASTANVYQLKRLFTEIAHLNPLPKYLILTGDIVMGYKTPSTPDTAELAKQLTAWKAIYESHPLSSMGIQLVAIPGNHETQDKAAGKKSFLSAEQIFTRVMAPYIRGNNGPGIGGPDSLTTDQSKLTYSFNFNGDHFIVLNTDPVGKDNQVPYKWLAADIQTARANNARHIFAFGHKPAYSSPLTPKGGLDADATLPQRDSLWKYLEDNNCEAMFSAHEHLWDSIHPHTGKTWQVIAGNGGSRVEPVWVGAGKQYYGYTLVNLYTDKKVNVMGLGRNTGQSTTAGGTPYPVNEDANPTTVRNTFNICLTTNSSTSITANNSYTWNGVTYTASGTYTKTLVNAAGCDSIAKLILQIVMVNQPPVVTITSPSNSSTVNTSNTILLNATATDADGTITKVEFYNNGVKFGEDSTAPYSFTGNEIEPGNYVITAKATDNSGASTVSDTVRVTVTGCSGSGSISAEGFTNIPGSQVADLIASSMYPNNPDVTASLTTFEYGNNLGDNYGARVRGYICAPQTGNYTFYVAGDDQAGLYLSTDENPANKILIAYNETHVNPRAWYTYPTQKSVTIRLVKGGRYYIETLHKEATGQDHLSVAWKLPNGAFEGPIAGSRLSPFITAIPARTSNFVAAMQSRSVAADAVKGLKVTVLPNPSPTAFTLITSSNSEKTLSINITDVQGRVVERKVNIAANGTVQIGSRLSAGVYFAEVMQGTEKQILKLVKK